MPYILDRTLFAGLLSGKLSLTAARHDEFLASVPQLREIERISDFTQREHLKSRFRVGVACSITDPDPEGGVELEWEQNGYDIGEIMKVFREMFSREPDHEIEADLSLIEVAFNEKATFVTDDADMRKLVAYLDGDLASSDHLTAATIC